MELDANLDVLQSQNDSIYGGDSSLSSCLDPSIDRKKCRWTPEEDTKLIEAVQKHGKDWVVVQQPKDRAESSIPPRVLDLPT
jgi:hypothetical protein